MKKIFTLIMVSLFSVCTMASMFVRGSMNSWSNDAAWQLTLQANNTYKLSNSTLTGQQWWKGSDGTAGSYISSNSGARTFTFTNGTNYTFWSRAQGGDVICQQSAFYLVGDNFTWTVSESNKMTLTGNKLSINKDMGTTAVGNFKIVDIDETGAINWSGILSSSANAFNSTLTGAITITFDFDTWSVAVTPNVVASVDLAATPATAELGQTINLTATPHNITNPVYTWSCTDPANATTTLTGTGAVNSHIPTTTGTYKYKVSVAGDDAVTANSTEQSVVVTNLKTPALVGTLGATTDWLATQPTSANKFTKTNATTWTLSTTVGSVANHEFKIVSSPDTYAWANDITSQISTFTNIEKLESGNLNPTITLNAGDPIKLILTRPDINQNVYSLKLENLAPLSGIYKVGTGGAYTKLSSACADLNTKGMNGNVVFEICSDITETSSSYIGVNTKTFSLTIRPDQDVNRKITFSKAADNSKASGLIIVGLSGDSWDSLKTNTKNVLIDGYPLGGATRRLTLEVDSLSNIYHGTIQIVGASENIYVKNCILTQKCLTSSSTTYNIRIRGEKNTSNVNFYPSKIHLENNIFNNTRNTTMISIGATLSTGVTTPELDSIFIVNNEINAVRRGTSMGNHKNVLIQGNTFKVNQLGSGYLSAWIQDISNAGGNIIIENNKFLEGSNGDTSAGTTGFWGIYIVPGAKYMIRNNFFTGAKRTGTTGSSKFYFIRNSGVTEIYNNTFYMNSLDGNTGGTSVYNCIHAVVNFPIVKNNIFVSEDGATTNGAFLSAITSTSDNNIFHIKNASNTKISTTEATLATRQTNTYDTNSRSVAVEFVDAANKDFRVGGGSVGDINLGFDRIATVLYDFYGTERYEYTYAGAHEASKLIKQVTEVVNPTSNIVVYNTTDGIGITFDGDASIEIYNISGQLIETTTAVHSFERALAKGIYIVRINGQTFKVIK